MSLELVDSYTSEFDPTFVILNDTDDWAAQSFTTTEAYDIEAVDVKLSKGYGDNVGTITISIKAVDGDGYPTGADLASGTIANDDVSDSAPNWEQCILDSAYSLSDSTQYAIVIRADGLSSYNTLSVRMDGDGHYDGGSKYFSADGGSSWNKQIGQDICFKTYKKGQPEFSGTIAAVVSEVVSLGFDTTGLAGTVEVLSDKTATLSFDTIGLAGIISTEAIISGNVDTDIAISGTISVAALLSGDLLYFNLIKPSLIATTKRLVAVGNNIIYYEDI